MFAEFDTILGGRKTFERMTGHDNMKMFSGMKVVVVSKSLSQRNCPGVTVVSHDVEKSIAALRQGEENDIWIFGGVVLFQSLLDAGLVDRVDVSVAPVLLGGGISLPSPGSRNQLKLASHKVYEKSGCVSLYYEAEKPTS